MGCSIAWEQSGVYRAFFDRADCDEFMQSLKEVHGDARFDDIRYVINDFTACTEIVFDAEAIREMSAMDMAASVSNPRIRIAIVGASEFVKAGIEAYMAKGLSPYPIQLFASLDEARRWLGRDALRS